MRFISQRHHTLLARHGLDTLGGFWSLPWNWVEEPNKRRNGWSGVSQHVFAEEAGGFSIFVKREENHNYRSLGHLFRAKPTFLRDFYNIRRMERLGIPTVEPVFYGERREGGKLQAVLATIALEGYSTLSDLFQDPFLAAGVRQDVLHRLADTVRLMHRHSFQHDSLGGNHVMVRREGNGHFDLRVLDLEKMRRNFRPVDVAARDLEKFIRHTPTITTDEYTQFLLYYARDFSASRRTRLIEMINHRLRQKFPERDLVTPTIGLDEKTVSG